MYWDVMTPGFIEELDNEEQVGEEEYEEMGGIYNPYEGL